VAAAKFLITNWSRHAPAEVQYAERHEVQHDVRAVDFEMLDFSGYEEGADLDGDYEVVDSGGDNVHPVGLDFGDTTEDE